MTKTRALNISISADGYMAGVDQSEESPLGKNGQLLHSWAFATHGFQKWHGGEGGSFGIDNDYIERGYTNIGATIMGRNMFGPIRGEWPDENWKGWWGESPVFGHPVFVLTHFPRRTLDMGNGTIFVFVTEGPKVAHEMALDAAGSQDIRVGGGAQTIQQYLDLGLLDELHIVENPINLGGGELLFSDKERQLKNFVASEPIASGPITHRTFLRHR